MPAHDLLSGGCHCGRVADAFEYAANCHCSRCRAATGSAFKPPWFEITDDLPQFAGPAT